jgi:uncharacterized protein (DUF1697 family)
MTTYVAFLRAVNVGGRIVKMEALRGHLAAAGFADVQTHIQSGNVRVDADTDDAEEVERRIEKALAGAVGFEVPAMVRTPAELATLVETSPRSPLGEQARHYVAFLRAEPAAPARARLDGWDVDGERLRVVGADLHIWLTKPSHEARATNARLEKMAMMPATSRSWTVVTAIAEKWGRPA